MNGVSFILGYSQLVQLCLGQDTKLVPGWVCVPSENYRVIHFVPVKRSCAFACEVVS